MTAELAPRLVEVLDRVTIAPDLSGATVDEHIIEAANPAELRERLTTALYETVHVGNTVRAEDLGETDFATRLAAAVPHEFTRTTGRMCSVTGSGEAIVELDGVRVRLPASSILAAEADQRVALRVPSARPWLSPGFVMVDGSLGHGLGSGRNLLRVYVHLNESEPAVEFWGHTLALLESLDRPYRVKISADRADFPRRDALVLYLGQQAWDLLPTITTELAALGGRGSEVSSYAQLLAAGLSIAWQPNDDRIMWSCRSFGEHRSMAIATGLIEQARDTGATTREQAVGNALRAGNIDPLRPFRNLDSPEIFRNGD
jgi:hypothetical protein